LLQLRSQRFIGKCCESNYIRQTTKHRKRSTRHLSKNDQS
jgi:hypothetical protein